MKINPALFKYFHFSKPVNIFTRFLLVSYCIVLISCPGQAQTKYLSGNYWIENYGKKEGLPEDVVIDVIQDRKGYMWIATPYNMVRFDGYQFKVYSSHKQFPDLYIHFAAGMVQDAEGIIWMPTIEKGLFSFDPATGKFSRFFAEATINPLSNNKVTAIIPDDDDNLWVGTADGLNLLTKNSGRIEIKQFNTPNPARLLKALDKILLQSKALAGFEKVGNEEKKISAIEIKEPTKLFVACMGEISDGMADYGWIEDDKGTRVWTMDDAKCVAAGGATKNRLQLDVVTLTPGKYKVFYQTDDSHSWNKWNEDAPKRPDLWGIQLFKLEPILTDSIEILLKSILENQSLHGSIITALLKKSKNSLWATTNAGLEKLNIEAVAKNKMTSEKIALSPNFYPTYYLLVLDSSRLILEGYIYNPQNKKTTIGSLIYDHAKDTFQLNDEGFLTYTSPTAKGFVRDKHKNYWMGSFINPGDGLYISDEGGDVPTFKKLDIRLPELRKAGKPYDQIWSTYEDRSGYIWVCTRGNGLFKIKTRKVPVRYTTIAIPGNDTTKLIFNQIKEDASGNIWLNTKDKGIFEYNRKTKQSTYFPQKNKTQPNSFIYSANESASIISENNQNAKYNSDNAAFKPLPIKIPDTLKLLTIDDNGNYWAVAKNRSAQDFFIFDGNKFQPVHFDSSVSKLGFSRNVHIGRNGNVWISPAFEGVQLYKLDNQTKKLHFVKRYLPEGVDVFDIYEDENGLVWGGTYDNGLIRMDPKTNSFKSFTRDEGAPSNFVRKIVPLNNKIWIITDLGTAFFNKETQTFSTNKELDDYIEQNTGPESFRSFSDNGYSDLAIKTQSGEIAFIARDGFCIFNPDDIPLDSVKPIVQISQLMVGGQPIEFEKAGDNNILRLKYNQNNLEIEYVGLQYDQPAKNKYSYLLKGANKDWVLAGTERIARYSNLPPGDYEFYLMAANADGIWSNSKKMFAFTILPPWWKTWWAYSLYALLIIAAIWSFIAFRSRWLKKENILLEAKVEDRTLQLNQSYENLKATQSQLIQSEKMASLGELTAGIAHEIQNPLNFVNNFSEVNKELIAEMREEIAKGNYEEVNALAKDVEANEEKINHHGKRADAIVKGMLQHSRTSNSIKESTDINALADEYFRLAYHGLRAKDKSFNATLKTDFDESIGKINIIAQDIGRVILNLITNAFYAVDEKKKHQSGAQTDYEPTVAVKTKKMGDKILISVKDNGNGISQKVLDKIFQPFFTTKPTGKGTGLGLSLAYDIAKAHGGEIRVETKEGDGTEFIIQLPIV